MGALVGWKKREDEQKRIWCIIRQAKLSEGMTLRKEVTQIISVGTARKWSYKMNN